MDKMNSFNVNNGDSNKGKSLVSKSYQGNQDGYRGSVYFGLEFPDSVSSYEINWIAREKQFTLNSITVTKAGSPIAKRHSKGKYLIELVSADVASYHGETDYKSAENDIINLCDEILKSSFGLKQIVNPIRKLTLEKRLARIGELIHLDKLYPDEQWDYEKPGYVFTVKDFEGGHWINTEETDRYGDPFMIDHENYSVVVHMEGERGIPYKFVTTRGDTPVDTWTLDMKTLPGVPSVGSRYSIRLRNYEVCCHNFIDDRCIVILQEIELVDDEWVVKN